MIVSSVETLSEPKGEWHQINQIKAPESEDGLFGKAGSLN